MAVVMVNFEVTVSGLKVKSNQELAELEAEEQKVLREYFNGRLGDFGTVDVTPIEYAGSFEE